MTKYEEQTLAVWGRIANALEVIAEAVMVDDDAPVQLACEHPPELRTDFSGMGSTEENWECRAPGCGYMTPARKAELAAEVVV